MEKNRAIAVASMRQTAMIREQLQESALTSPSTHSYHRSRPCIFRGRMSPSLSPISSIFLSLKRIRRPTESLTDSSSFVSWQTVSRGTSCHRPTTSAAVCPLRANSAAPLPQQTRNDASHYFIVSKSGGGIINEVCACGGCSWYAYYIISYPSGWWHCSHFRVYMSRDQF